MRLIRWGAYVIAAAALVAGIRMYVRAAPPPVADGPALPVPTAPRSVTILAEPASVESVRPPAAPVSNVGTPESVSGNQRATALREVVSSLEGEAIYVEGVDHAKKRAPRPKLPGPGDARR